MPDSPPPVSYDEEEVTEVTRAARRGDPKAIKLKHLENKQQEARQMIKDLQTAVMGSPDGKTRGMAHKLDSIESSWTTVKVLLGALFALMTLSVAAYAAFREHPPSAQDVAHEVLRQQSGK